MYTMATKLETILIQGWFGGGANPFDHNRTRWREFTYKELVDLERRPTEEPLWNALRVLWNLWEKAGCPSKFVVYYYDPDS